MAVRYFRDEAQIRRYHSRHLLAHPLPAQLLADEAVDALHVRRRGGRNQLRPALGDLEHELAADRFDKLVGGPHDDNEGAGAADDAILVVDVEIADRGEAAGP